MSLIDDIKRAQIRAGEEAVVRSLDEMRGRLRAGWREREAALAQAPQPAEPARDDFAPEDMHLIVRALLRASMSDKWSLDDRRRAHALAQALRSEREAPQPAEPDAALAQSAQAPEATLKLTLEFADEADPIGIIVHGTRKHINRLAARVRYWQKLEAAQSAQAPTPAEPPFDQIEQARRNIAEWPQWMRDAASEASAHLPNGPAPAQPVGVVVPAGRSDTLVGSLRTDHNLKPGDMLYAAPAQPAPSVEPQWPAFMDPKKGPTPEAVHGLDERAAQPAPSVEAVMEVARGFMEPLRHKLFSEAVEALSRGEQ